MDLLFRRLHPRLYYIFRGLVNDPHNLDGILQNAEARNNESSVSKRREAIPGRITFSWVQRHLYKWQQ